jgi:hypothetical protein
VRILAQLAEQVAQLAFLITDDSVLLGCDGEDAFSVVGWIGAALPVVFHSVFAVVQSVGCDRVEFGRLLDEVQQNRMSQSQQEWLPQLTLYEYLSQLTSKITVADIYD